MQIIEKLKKLPLAEVTVGGVILGLLFYGLNHMSSRMEVVEQYNTLDFVNSKNSIIVDRNGSTDIIVLGEDYDQLKYDNLRTQCYISQVALINVFGVFKTTEYKYMCL